MQLHSPGGIKRALRGYDYEDEMPEIFESDRLCCIPARAIDMNVRDWVEIQKTLHYAWRLSELPVG